MPPFFSVVLPTYNRARMARTAVKTVQYQSLSDWECWVVDDGSTDETPRMLEEFSKDQRIRILRLDKNSGMNASRNLAIERAQGRFVTFLDSDDLWLPKRLERFKERIERSPETGFVFSNAYLLRFGRIVGALFDPGREIPEGKLPGYYAVGERHLPYVTTNVAICREAFGRWGRFKTEMKTLDTELFARFLAGGLAVAAIKDPLSLRRIHGEQLTDRYLENFEESMRALESSGAPPEIRREMRSEICGEVALCLVKSGRPLEARSFLLSEMGDRARSTPVYWMTFVPSSALKLAKALRQGYLVLRHHPLWAPAEFREAYGAITPLLAVEKGL